MNPDRLDPTRRSARRRGRSGPTKRRYGADFAWALSRNTMVERAVAADRYVDQFDRFALSQMLPQ